MVEKVKKIGYFDSSHDLPEEIIMAAGFVPEKILGNVNSASDLADQYLFKTFCPYSRSVLNEALKDPKRWEGFIIAHGCDATNRQLDIWKYHVETPFLYFFYKPLKTDKLAKKFLRRMIELLIETLKKKFNVEITDEKLRKAIEISNTIKRLLRELASLRAEKNIKNSEYFNVLKRALTEDKSLLIAEFTNILNEWKNRTPFTNDKKRVLLTGSDVNYVEFFELLDSCGLRVVRDDLSIGERYFNNEIPLNKESDPIDAIIEYHLSIPRPSTKHPSDPRLDYLLKCLKQTKIDGVIVQNLKFCEPYAFDSVWITNSLKSSNIKVINIERDYSGSFDQQLKNRLEAFKEMI